MTLRGDVQSLNLASLLQNFASEEKTGTLSLSQDDRLLHLWFEKGQLRLVGLGGEKGPSILNGLLAMARVSGEEASPSRKGRESGRLRALAGRDGISDQEIRRALAQQMTEYVCESFLWTRAAYEFQEGAAPRDRFDLSQLDHEIRLPVDGLVMEALRRQDEWREIQRWIVPSTEILLPNLHRVPTDPAPAVVRVFSAINGERTLGEILDFTGLGPFTVYKTVATLMRCQAARSMTVAEALHEAKARQNSRDFSGAIRYALYGLEREPNHAELRALAAEACGEAGRIPEAVTYFRRLGAGLAQAGEADAALAAYRRLLSLAPSDLHAHEAVLNLLLHSKSRPEIVSAAEAFAQAARKVGLPDKVREIYSKLLAVLGEDERLRRNLADLERYLGRIPEALEQYDRLLKRALQERRDRDALDHARSILALDPARNDVAKLREELEGGLREKRRGVRRRRRILIAVASVLLLAATAGIYELAARLDLAAERPHLLEAAVEGRYRESLERTDEYMARWPGTFAAGEIAADRRRVEERYLPEILARAEHHERRGEWSSALETVSEARRLARNEEFVARAAELASRLETGRAHAEAAVTATIRSLVEGSRRPGGEEAVSKIAAARDPLAVPALRECLRDRDPSVRRAAIAALGGMTDPDLSLPALLEALSDPDAGLRTMAVGHLSARTGQSFGDDASAWDRWMRLQVGEGQAPLLQPLLLPVPGARPAGDPLEVEWRIRNLGSEPIELVLADPFADLILLAADGTRTPLALRRLPSRTATLGPGDHLGGTIELTEALPTGSSPGPFRLLWRPTVHVEERSFTLQAPPALLSD